MSSPEVSVILPAFNRLKYLREAVDSVLAQTFDGWELIIADDGSGDEVRTYLNSLGDPRIKIMILPHSGNPAVVRNWAIGQARGNYLAFQDSDDVWLPHKLERQLELQRARPDRRWSYTDISRIDEHGHPDYPSRLVNWRPYEGVIVEPLLRLEALVATPTVMAERSLVNEAGGFDPAAHYVEDYDLWLRLALRSEVSVSCEPLVCVRNHHADRYSRDRFGAFCAMVRLYEKMADEVMPDRRLRSLCRRRQGARALDLAGLHLERGDSSEVIRTVLGASTYSWPYPAWWWGATKALVKPMLPARLRVALLALKRSTGEKEPLLMRRARVRQTPPPMRR